jgi:curli biogenesis system outer membrane secretion channel CsgG
MKIFLTLALGLCMGSQAIADQMPQTPQPRVAIYGFKTEPFTYWWNGSGFDPGEALADVMTNELVNAGPYNVIDRTHLETVKREQKIADAGDVSPASEAELGHMLGVNYLIFGDILEFDKSNAGGGGLGGFGGGLGALGGVKSQKFTLHVNVKIIEANTGRIVASVDDSESKTGTSFAVGGAGIGAGGAAYASPDFTNSTVGQLITQVADNIVKKIDPSKLVASAPGPSINAHVLSASDDMVIINAGTNKGVTVGTYFNVYDVKVFHDPDSGKMVTSHIKKGSIQIISVDSDTATGKKMDGFVHVGQAAISGE